MLFILILSFSLSQGTPQSNYVSNNPELAYENYVSFQLINNSVKSIPLIIPGVMNPNLSPFSNSGVSLKPGQKIYFKKKMKRYLLLEVDETYRDKKVDVANLIKKRNKELEL